MDKITRMLILYSSLMRGDEINKTIFCFENHCSSRTFDRDIEDVRLFLSESFSMAELNYNRLKNTYSINREVSNPLEMTEYLFLENILRTMGILRKDEFETLKSHLLSNTSDAQKKLSLLSLQPYNYHSPTHDKALLKLYGDLEIAIRTYKYIKIFYQEEEEVESIVELIPCGIKFEVGRLFFTGYKKTSEEVLMLSLDKIYSFEILRDLNTIEKAIADSHKDNKRNEKWRKEKR